MFGKTLLFEMVYKCMMFYMSKYHVEVTRLYYRYSCHVPLRLSIPLQMKKKMLHFKKKSSVIGFVS